jgi:hypothetical protein
MSASRTDERDRMQLGCKDHRSFHFDRHRALAVWANQQTGEQRRVLGWVILRVTHDSAELADIEVKMIPPVESAVKTGKHCRRGRESAPGGRCRAHLAGTKILIGLPNSFCALGID